MMPDKPRRGRAQIRQGEPMTSGKESSPLWDALGMMVLGRGRLRDPRTYLLLAAGNWIEKWLSDTGGDSS